MSFLSRSAVERGVHLRFQIIYLIFLAGLVIFSIEESIEVNVHATRIFYLKKIKRKIRESDDDNDILAYPQVVTLLPECSASQNAEIHSLDCVPYGIMVNVIPSFLQKGGDQRREGGFSV